MGAGEEEDQTHPEVHPCHHWCHAQRYHGQEEPEARGPQGSARAGYQSFQRKAEGEGGSKESNQARPSQGRSEAKDCKECPESSPSCRRKAMNLMTLNA